MKKCLQVFLPLKLIIVMAFVLGIAWEARADTISGTVKDASGGVVAGAQIEISGAELAKPVVLNSDASGKFISPDLKGGKYTLRITSSGFEPQTKEVELKGAVELQITL